MKKKYGFTLLTPDEFEAWLMQRQVARTVLYVQEHHTFVPNYSHFKGNNHFELQRGMRNYHKAVNGWADIAQHFSIFPDGLVVTGRSLEMNPSCITGFNANAICIENIGNFDPNGDIMRQEQRMAILHVTAALCKRFRIPINTDRVVYHHWFDLNTGARTDGKGSVKTCPGATFFGGNKPESAKANFIPQVAALLGAPSGTSTPAVFWYGSVMTDSLNIRNAPSVNGKKMNAAKLGAVLRVYEEKNGWLRISAKNQEWVSAKLVARVERGTVNADILNVRSGPGVQFNKLGKVRQNEAVFVYAERNGWLRIGLDERWVTKKLVSFV